MNKKLISYNDWMAARDLSIPKQVPKIIALLEMSPETAMKDAIELWKRQRRLTIELL